MATTNPTSKTVSMKGGGYYSLHTKGAKDAIDNTLPLAHDALAAIDVEGGEGAFNLADIGAADGGTSIDLIASLVEQVRERAPTRPITVTYTDLPRNDFSALFRMLDGSRGEFRSYLQDYENVFAFASGTSFHRQILPSESLDLGFSATAMHWISRIPGQITDHVHAAGAAGAEFAAFRECALRDWDNILLNRARELRAGGRLVMANLCIDEEGRHLGNTGGVSMLETFNSLWGALVDDNAITEEEYQRTAFPQFYKTAEEHCAPLTDPDRAVHRAGLRLVSAETRIVECPYAAEFRECGDTDAFAAAYVPTTRSWSEIVFMSALNASRALEERRAIVDRFYQSYVDLVRRDPTDHRMDYVYLYMVLAKL